MYSNKVSTVHAVHASIEKKLDETGTETNQLHTMDVLKVIGPQTVQKKAHQLAVFMSKANSSFYPSVIVATSVTCNAGINCGNMVGVFRIDMPSSCIDVIQ